MPPITDSQALDTVFSPRALGAIWCRLLSTDSVSDGSNFFVDGGDSITLVALASGIREQFGVDLPILTIFEAQTFGKLAREIERYMEVKPF